MSPTRQPLLQRLKAMLGRVRARFRRPRPTATPPQTPTPEPAPAPIPSFADLPMPDFSAENEAARAQFEAAFAMLQRLFQAWSEGTLPPESQTNQAGNRAQARVHAHTPRTTPIPRAIPRQGRILSPRDIPEKNTRPPRGGRASYSFRYRN